MSSYQYIYAMKDLTKTYQAGREVLDNITLAFLPGAKIGVLGYNGAGKSTLLKIMAGIETEFNGEARAAEGATVGYLPQEPVLDESLDQRAEEILCSLKPQQREHRAGPVLFALGERLGTDLIAQHLAE